MPSAVEQRSGVTDLDWRAVAMSEALFPTPRRRAELSPALLLCALVLARAVPELFAASTIYVGQHFEIRDHDAPVKYIFNGDTRVVRVTGSLPASERIQRLRLRAGWNLVSFTITASNTLQQLSAATAGGGSRENQFDQM